MRLEGLKEKIENLETKILAQQKQIDALERSQRKNNIIIYGADVAGSTKYEELEEKIIELLKNKMQIDLEAREISEVRIISKQKEKKSNIGNLCRF